MRDCERERATAQVRKTATQENPVKEEMKRPTRKIPNVKKENKSRKREQRERKKTIIPK